LLKDSVPCPIPFDEKDAVARSFFALDITHGIASFNQ
jgi:hypothetical protein